MDMPKQIDPRDHELMPPFPGIEQQCPGTEGMMFPKPDHGEDTYRGHRRLANRAALITGGDSGIGRAVAVAFAREGADVAISYFDESEREDAIVTLEWIENAGRRGYAQRADLSKPEDCAALVLNVAQKFGRLDILVNNAAHQGKAVERMEDIDPERVRYTLAANVESVFNVTREALAHLGEGAVVINTTSIQAEDPSFQILDYACTKAAIENLTKGMSRELLGRGIRVNAVAPGPVWTPLIAQSFDSEKIKHFGEKNPMGRPAQPAELAPAYVFLASDDSRFVTGEVLAVTGGRLFV
jgi:NAD(P)-dependent dehydrogenase (short-subunit alcohol dehydrogenase family)